MLEKLQKTKINYYEEIKQKLIDNEIYERVKDYSKERNRVVTYYEVGRLLAEAGSIYGKNIIGNYSEKLVNEIGKKYNYRTLYRMRKLYEIFNNEKLTPLVSKLSWSHCIILFSIKDIDKINYYINQILIRNLSKRELEEIIKNKEYERLPENTKIKLMNKEESKVQDFIKNPVIIKNPNNYEIISERILKRLILEDIDNFLKELGDSFSYIANEYKIKIGSTYNYIDILLFNIEYNCYVVLELKVTPLKKEHIGQIEVYMNYIDNNLKKTNQDKTIGIILVKKDNKFIMGYRSDSRILSKEYELV